MSGILDFELETVLLRFDNVLAIIILDHIIVKYQFDCKVFWNERGFLVDVPLNKLQYTMGLITHGVIIEFKIQDGKKIDAQLYTIAIQYMILNTLRINFSYISTDYKMYEQFHFSMTQLVFSSKSRTKLRINTF